MIPIDTYLLDLEEVIERVEDLDIRTDLKTVALNIRLIIYSTIRRLEQDNRASYIKGIKDGRETARQQFNEYYRQEQRELPLRMFDMHKTYEIRKELW